jgi:hypothetical protein
LEEEGIQPVKSLFLYLSSIEAESPLLISQFYRSIHFLSSASVVTMTSHQSINQLRNIYLPLMVVKVPSHHQTIVSNHPPFRLGRPVNEIVPKPRSPIYSTRASFLSFPVLFQSRRQLNRFRPPFQRYLSTSPLLRVSNPIFGLPFHRYHQGSQGSSTIGAGRVSWWTRPYTRITATSESRLLPNS